MLSQNVRRYIPLSVWIVVVFTIIVIPLKIIGYGYLPPRFFKDVLAAFWAWRMAHRVTLTPR